MILNPLEIQQLKKNMCRILLQSETDRLKKEIQQKNIKIEELVQKMERLSQSQESHRPKDFNSDSNSSSHDFLMWL